MAVGKVADIAVSTCDIKLHIVLMEALFYQGQYLSINMSVFTTVLKLMMLDIFMNFFK